MNSLRICLALLSCASSVWSATVWTGPNVVFSKGNNVDVTLPANQDRLDANVWITRGGTRSIYNIKTESGYDRPVSPEGTKWAFLGYGGNTSDPLLFNASNHSSLIFSSFVASLGGGQVGNNIVGTKAVMHLLASDVYLDVVFTSWKPGGGGGFSYARATQTPQTASDVPLLPGWAVAAMAFTLLVMAQPFMRQNAMIHR